MEEVFTNNPEVTFNRTSFPKFTCNSGGHTYTPGLLHQRQMLLSFDDDSGLGEQSLPISDIGYIPFAVTAYDSQLLAGTSAAQYLKVASGTATALTSVQFSELLKIINGASTVYAKPGELGGQSLPTLAANEAYVWNGNSWSTYQPISASDVKDFAKNPLPSDCGTTKFLRTNPAGDGLICAEPASGGGSGVQIEIDPTVKVFAQKNPGAGLLVNSSDELVVDVGFTAGKIVALDGSGRLPLLDGSLLTDVVVKVSNLKNSTGLLSAFDVSSCTSAQTLVWSSIADQFRCQDINLPANKVSGLATVATTGSYSDLSGAPTLGSLASKSSVNLTTDISGILPVSAGGYGGNSAGQNQFFAGPESGGSGSPGFRTIAAADLPAAVKLWNETSGGISYLAGKVSVGTNTLATGEALTVLGGMNVDRIVAGQIKLNWVTMTGAQTGTALTLGQNVFLDVSGGSISLTLPQATHGSTIKLVHAAGLLSTNNVTLTPYAGDSVVGTTTLTLDIDHGSIELIFFDSNGDGQGDWRLL